MAVAIDSLIPRETTFTYLDIKTGPEALDPGRIWKERTIHAHLSKLREKGMIRRLKRATQSSFTIYVRAEVLVKLNPLDDMTLAEVVAQVLTKPMTTAEVMVAAIEFGYRSTMPPRRLQKYVGVVLRRGEFRRDGEKWTAG